MSSCSSSSSNLYERNTSQMPAAASAFCPPPEIAVSDVLLAVAKQRRQQALLEQSNQPFAMYLYSLMNAEKELGISSVFDADTIEQCRGGFIPEGDDYWNHRLHQFHMAYFDAVVQLHGSLNIADPSRHSLLLSECQASAKGIAPVIPLSTVHDYVPVDDPYDPYVVVKSISNAQSKAEAKGKSKWDYKARTHQAMFRNGVVHIADARLAPYLASIIAILSGHEPNRFIWGLHDPDANFYAGSADRPESMHLHYVLRMRLRPGCTHILRNFETAVHIACTAVNMLLGFASQPPSYITMPREFNLASFTRSLSSRTTADHKQYVKDGHTFARTLATKPIFDEQCIAKLRSVAEAMRAAKIGPIIVGHHRLFASDYNAWHRRVDPLFRLAIRFKNGQILRERDYNRLAAWSFRAGPGYTAALAICRGELELMQLARYIIGSGESMGAS